MTPISEMALPSVDNNLSLYDYALIFMLKKLEIRNSIVTWAVWATEKTNTQKALIDFLLKHHTLTEDELIAEMHHLIPD